MQVLLLFSLRSSWLTWSTRILAYKQVSLKVLCKWSIVETYMPNCTHFSWNHFMSCVIPGSASNLLTKADYEYIITYHDVRLYYKVLRFCLTIYQLLWIIFPDLCNRKFGKLFRVAMVVWSYSALHPRLCIPLFGTFYRCSLTTAAQKIQF